MELGTVTFAKATAQRSTAATPHAQRLREVAEEADQVGLDVDGVGEHRRADLAAPAPAPAVVLAAAA